MAFRSLLSLTLLATTLASPTTKPKRAATPFPDYVLTYAPYTHLLSTESWWPSDIATHVQHVIPKVDFVAIAAGVTLENLSTFNDTTYLTSMDNVEDNPAWLLNAAGKPTASGYSSAPATIIVAEKDGGIVDAFYFYFYSYNHGNKLFNTRYGNHVGDWEHTMVRFIDGVPSYIYLSAHDGTGTAYTYSALPATNGRATTYIAGGSHANYVSTGKQSYGAPFGLLSDTTDAGPFWDVTLNFRGFWYDTASGTFSSEGGADVGAAEQAVEDVSWLYFWGLWGDKQLPTSDSRQNCLDGNCHYVDGPNGPIAKNLGRTTVCQKDDCTILTSV